MSKKTGDLTHLVALAAEPDAESRERVFRETMDILIDPSLREASPERAIAADILHHLLHEVETRLRWELASRVSDRQDAPEKLIRALAMEEIEIAFPVLQQSPILKDPDLIDVITERSQAHQLAIARRESLSETVSEALFNTDDSAVVKALLNNPNATMSRTMLEFLVEESKWQHAYQEPLVRRWDLPVDLATKLYWWVAAPLKLELMSRFELDPDILDDQIAEIVDHGIAEIARRQQNPTKTQTLVSELHGRGELTLAFLLNALTHGETGLFEEGLITLTGLRPTLIKRLIHESTGQALAVICRSLGGSTSDYLSMYAMTRQENGRSRPLSSAERRETSALYRNIDEKTSRLVMRRWNRDPEYSRALDIVSDTLKERDDA